MAISTLTDKGQTTVPREIRNALKVKPRQQLNWSLTAEGNAMVSPQRSALGLFGSLKSPVKFSSRAAERRAVANAVGRQAAKEGAK